MSKQFTDIEDLSRNKPVMLVFLRHFGCTFCRETLVELSRLKSDFLQADVNLVLVHMSSAEYARQIFEIYELSGVEQISDPQQTLYKKYGLGRGKWWQLLGLPVVLRGISGVFRGHLPGKPAADPFQMPGVFVIRNNKVQAQFIHRYASDKPAYRQLLNS